MYEYCFNNNDRYEDEWEESIFSFEEIPFEEFEEIVKKAYAECEKVHPVYKRNVDFVEVKNQILKMDKRFFTPKLMATAFIGMGHDPDSDDDDNYDSIIRHIYNHNK